MQLRPQFQPTRLENLPVVIVVCATDDNRVNPNAGRETITMIPPFPPVAKPKTVLAIHTPNLLLDNAGIPLRVQ